MNSSRKIIFLIVGIVFLLSGGYWFMLQAIPAFAAYQVSGQAVKLQLAIASAFATAAMLIAGIMFIIRSRK